MRVSHRGQRDRDACGAARHLEQVRLMNELPKFVVSDRLERVEWHNSHIIKGSVAEQIRALKQQPGGDIALFAGANVASSFTGLGLIDEYRLILNPTLLGSGKPLFAGGYERTDLRLLRVRPFKSGAAVLYYEPVESKATRSMEGDAATVER
jgi:dihydrofolate reductase